MLIVLFVSDKEGLSAGKDASMGENSVATGSVATRSFGAQALLKACEALPGELAERLGAQVKRVAELVGRFFAGRPDAAGHV